MIMTNSKEGFTFTWKIKNFSMLPHQKGEILESPSFTIDMLMKTKWVLKLYPRGEKSTEESFISCYLRRPDFDLNPDPITLGFSITIQSEDFPAVTKTTGSTFYSIDSKGLGFRLLNYCEEKKHRYFPRDILTITCHIWPSEEKITTSKTSDDTTRSCSVVTQIKVQMRTCIWPVRKINRLKEKEEKSSMNLESSLDDVSSLKLSFYMGKNSNDEYANVEICQNNFRPDQIKERNFVKCKLTVLCALKEFQDSYEASHLFSSNQDEIWRFPEFIKKSNLVDEKYIYTDNTLFLQCEISLSRKGSEYHLEMPRYVPCALQGKSSSELSQLSGSIQQLYASRKFCDVSLCAGGRTFPFYKLVLCARSPVFRAMFENDMKESKTGEVEVTDLDSDTMERMLIFMHSDVLEENLSTEDLCKLYSAADKYQIVPLKRQCSLLLLSSMSLQNVWDALAIADRHQDNFLLTIVHGFIRSHSHEIPNCLEWENFTKSNPELSSEIIGSLNNL